MIDTHCHLTDERIFQNLPGVLQRSEDSGVDIILCATSDIQDSEQAASIAKQHRGIFCTAGIHPHEAGGADEAAIPRIEALLQNQECVALGEVGLDYHYNFSPRDDQKRVFAMQLDLAARTGSRVIIHTREAFEDTVSILAESGVDPTGVVFHSFTGGPDEGRRILDMGCAISFSGMVTFKKADDIRRTAAMVPDDMILAETDAPYLSPEPVRKMKVNEPANVVHIAKRLATIRDVQPETMSRLLCDNARRILGLQLD